MDATMRAVQQATLVPAEELEVVEVERPEVGPTEVLVRVHAAGVNPVDWKTCRGGGIAGLVGDGPFVPGWDVSGVVAEVGEGVTRFRVGDEVFGMPRFPHPAGAYAEYVAAPSRQVARKPANLDHVAAAAVPLAALTAWQALYDTAQVGDGDRVLVHAAAGGVGHLAVQLAKLRGAHVIGTASAAKHDFLRQLGVDELIDYRTTDFAEVAQDVGVVVDLVGGDHVARSLPTLQPGGLLITLPSPAAPEARRAADEAGVRLSWLLVEPDHHALAQIADLIARGELRIHVGAVFPLDDAALAHETGRAGKALGKIVLEVAR